MHIGLAKKTGELERDVQRLSRELDQSIARLHRARDLINNTVFALNTAITPAVLVGKMAPKELTLLRTGVDVPLMELRGLGDVIGDSLLQEKIDDLWELTRGDKLDIERQDEWGKYLIHLDRTAHDLHKRVYQLLREATAVQVGR